MKLFLFLIFIIFIFIIPLPLKIKFTFNGKNYEMYIYHKQVLTLDREARKKTERAAKKAKRRGLNYRTLLRSFNNLKLKPSLNFKLNLTYGFGDAAATGITYGLIYNLHPLVYQIFLHIFKVNKYIFNIEPDFDKQIFELSVESIISANLVKIIYMVIAVFRNYKLNEKLVYTNKSNINL